LSLFSKGILDPHIWLIINLLLLLTILYCFSFLNTGDFDTANGECWVLIFYGDLVLMVSSLLVEK